MTDEEREAIAEKIYQRRKNEFTEGQRTWLYVSLMTHYSHLATEFLDEPGITATMPVEQLLTKFVQFQVGKLPGDVQRLKELKEIIESTSKGTDATEVPTAKKEST